MRLEDLPAGFIDRLIGELRSVPGVEAIALGGSRARGTAHPGSDVDLGIYFRPEASINVAKLDQVVSALDDRKTSGLITRIGEWGPWIVGGGWLKIEGRAVDLLYRNLGQVESVVRDCRAGQITCDYQVGHPHGYPSSIYVGETAICQQLFDPARALERLKALVVPYPQAMKRELIRRFGWEAQFSLDVGRKGIARADVSYVAGCAFRTVACLVQVLFAVNEEHLINEKGSLAMAAGFVRCPDSLTERVTEAFASLVPNTTALARTFDVLQALKVDVDSIAVP